MKKLIFLLLIAVVMVGFLPAGETAHPPEALTLEAEMFGSGVDAYAVNPDTVLTIMLDFELLLSESLATPDIIIELPGSLQARSQQQGNLILILQIDAGLYSYNARGQHDYWLRL